jgi:hypothetical protein
LLLGGKLSHINSQPDTLFRILPDQQSRGKKIAHTDGELKTAISEEKILADAMWDGLHGIITNIKEDTPESLFCGSIILFSLFGVSIISGEDQYIS